jgi:hypothetical protein
VAEDFLVMLRGAWLPDWLDAAEASGIDELTRFAGKLQTD